MNTQTKTLEEDMDEELMYFLNSESTDCEENLESEPELCDSDIEMDFPVYVEDSDGDIDLDDEILLDLEKDIVNRYDDPSAKTPKPIKQLTRKNVEQMTIAHEESPLEWVEHPAEIPDVNFRKLVVPMKKHDNTSIKFTNEVPSSSHKLKPEYRIGVDNRGEKRYIKGEWKTIYRNSINSEQKRLCQTYLMSGMCDNEECAKFHRIPACRIFRAGKKCQTRDCPFRHGQTECEYGPRCHNEKCNRFHAGRKIIQNIDVSKPPPLLAQEKSTPQVAATSQETNKKFRMCQNPKPCTYNLRGKCFFSHSWEELEKNTPKCKGCTLVKLAKMRNGLPFYVHTSLEACCNKFHDKETPQYFTLRLKYWQKKTEENGKKK